MSKPNVYIYAMRLARVDLVNRLIELGNDIRGHDKFITSEAYRISATLPKYRRQARKLLGASK